MTDNQKTQNISYEELVGDMESRFGYMLSNDMYNGEHAKEFDVLEEMLCDIECASDEHTRQEQEAGNAVLVAFSQTLPSVEIGGGCGERGDHCRPDTVLPPSYSTSGSPDKSPILTKEPSISPDVVPGLVTRDYLCNDTPTPSSPGNAVNLPESALKIKHGDFDGGAKSSFFGTWNPPDFVTLKGQLDSAKTRAKRAQQSNPQAEPEPEIITLAGRDVIVHPSGLRIGQAYYAYHLIFEGYDVFIHPDEIPKNDNPPIRVDYGAESTLRYGLYGAQQVLLDFLGKLGFTKSGEKVSRIDIQIMIDVPVSAFTKLYLGDHDVGRASNFRINGKKKTFGKQIETFTIGDIDRCQLCIYDKRLDLNKEQGSEFVFKREKTIENIGAEWWDSDRPITRVEFRLSRAVLKMLGVNSLEDFRQREKAIVEWLTHNWFRLLKNPKIRGTENDAEIHPLWERVRALFFQYFSCAEVPEVKWEKPTRVSVDSKQLEKIGMGCFNGVALVGYGKQKNAESLCRVFKHIVACYFLENGHDILEKYNRRVDLVQVAKGVVFGKESEAVSDARERFDNPTLRLKRE